MKILITGAARGIGLELTKQALLRGDDVMAVVRKPSVELKALQRDFAQHLTILEADVTDPLAPARVGMAVEKGWGQLDILINNAGILRPADTRDDFVESFAINSIAPFFLTQALLKSLKASAQPRVVNISSLMGSIADNSSGGHHSYRASKAALNMINKSLAIDHPWLTAMVLHPGWVKTEMGGPQAPTAAEESARGLWNVILTSGREQSGRYFDFRGKALTW